MLPVIGGQGVGDGYRITHPIAIHIMLGQNTAVRIFFVRTQHGKFIVSCQHGVGLLNQSLLLQVGTHVCQTNTGNQFEFTIDIDTGVDLGMITVAFGVVHNASFIQVTQGDIVFCYRVATFNTQHIVGHHGWLINFVLPIGSVVVQVVVIVVRIIN
ncbi:hypothetical protein NC99_27850 [Sunxiuqinia dokdonensis]|uniref:Uncharacterized protein n=1 Tax=Sunxiuqinia dokdonensis TaxID=1409788 RepID=A0A0L8V7I0_9BACT|nr:hypothetical protein NC99_27850 [Sunxiuqinia dokdonensis]